MKAWQHVLARACARGRRSLGIARLLGDVDRRAVSAAVALNVVIGLLPLGFISGTGLMLGRVAAATGSATHGADGWSLLSAAAVALTALALHNVMTPFQPVLGELIARQVDSHCTSRLMRASLERAPLALLERQDVLGQLNDARNGLDERSATPGAAAAGLLALVARYTQLLGALALVAAVAGGLASASLAFAAGIARASNRGALARWARVVKRLSSRRKRMRYVVDSGSDPRVAKDFRVLGLLPWWLGRAGRELDGYLQTLWKERRKIYFRPFIVFVVLQLLATTMAFVAFGTMDLHALSITELSMGIQATLIPIRFGVFFPESDVQTQFGMQAHDAIERLEARVAGESMSEAVDGRSAAGLPKQRIWFEGVSFSYPGSDFSVLRGFDLDLKAGSSTAIVGLNGAGKTTLVKLLARLYEPSSGAIKVDGVNLRELDRRSWHRQLAIIFQDYLRYEVDAAFNVGLGAPDRVGDESMLRWALDRAGASEIVDALPAGQNTVLSSRYVGGVDLSGGQWQRIALARALFAVRAGASILLLDEPTAQLDVRAEVAFYDRFLELTRGLTTIVISHRFSTVRRADRIVVVAEGRVIEDGSHEELMQRAGRYAELFHLQARRFAEEEALEHVRAT